MTRQDGFSLIELLVASLITLIVVGGAFELAAPAQRMFQAQPEAADMQQRMRVAADSLRRDLVMAGAGTYAGPALGPLTDNIAPVMPLRAFGDSPDQVRNIFFRSDAISFLYVPSTPSQTRLSAALAPGALDPLIETAPNCPVATTQQVCGFASGDRVLLVDTGSDWDVYSVDQVVNGAMTLLHRGNPSSAAYPVGSAVSEIRAGSYFLKSDIAAGTYQLMRHDGWTTELPVVDEVVALEFRYFGVAHVPQLTGVPLDATRGPWTTYGPAPPPIGVARGSWPRGENCVFAVVDGSHVSRLATIAPGGLTLVELTSSMLTDGPWCPDSSSTNRFDADLLRIRRIHVSLRVQSALASLRGPAGTLFAHGGTARAGDRFVPDLVTQFDVTPRNLNLSR
jgi:prepilin-type N-terminal cleavage/methylation domain-containing protein